MKLLDTDFLIELLLGEQGAITKAEELDKIHGVATTILNVFELYKVCERLVDSHDFDALAKIDLLLSHVKILPLEKGMFPSLAFETFNVPLQDLTSERSVRHLIREIARRNGIKTIISRRPWLYEKFSVEDY